MTRQDNNISDKSSAKSLADLYEKAKSGWTEDIQSMLDCMIDGIHDITDWLLTDKEIDQLVQQIEDKKGSIKSSFAFQLRKNLNDFKNMRRTRSHKDIAESWRGTDSLAREGQEQNPELKSIIQQYGEEYSDITETLFQRLQICVDRSNVEEHENPICVKNLCFSFRNSIDNLHLETKYEAALYRYFASKILSELTPQYRKLDDLLVKQGVLLDVVPATKSPESDNQSDSISSPLEKEINTKPEISKHLSEQNSPDSLVISRRFQLLIMLHEQKKISRSASSKYNNIFTDLKKTLSEAGITDIDKEFDLVSFLYNFVFSSKNLPEEIKLQLARLQSYVLLSAVNEAGYTNQPDNPAQLLLDTVVKTEIELVESGRSDQSGNLVLRNAIDRLIETPSVTFKSYSDLLDRYLNHIDDSQRKSEQEEQKKKVEEVARLQKILAEKRKKKTEEEARLEKIQAEEQKKKAEEEARREKIEAEERKKKAEEEARLEKIQAEEQKKKAEEEARLAKIDEKKQQKRAEEEERLKRIEEARLQRIEKERQQRAEEEKQLKRAEEEKRQKKIRDQERLKLARIEALKKQQREKEHKLIIDQTAKMRQLVKLTMEEITIPLLALNKPFILFDKVWSPLLVQIALADGIKSAIWEKTLRMARNQVWSLIPKSNASELQKLVAIRPHIANSLVRGMHSLKLSASLQKSLVEYLRLEYEEVVKKSSQNIKILKSRALTKGAKQPARQNTGVKKFTPAIDERPVTSPASGKDNSEFIHDLNDLHFNDSEAKIAHDSEDMIIDNSDDDVIIAGSKNDLIIEDSDDDTQIEGSEDVIIDEISDFSDSMKTGIYQLSSEMLRALNSVVPGKSSQNSGATEADSIKQGDWVEIKQGSNKVMAKLTWRAADNSLYIFVDGGGKRVREIDGETLNNEVKSGAMKLVKSSSAASTKSQFSVVK